MNSATPLSLDLQRASQTCLSLGRVLGHLLLIFFARHWLVGLANAGVTVLAGGAVLWLASRLWPLRSGSAVVLRLKRLVYLAALFKGALYLTIGESLTMAANGGLFRFGLQLAPPRHLDLFRWRGHYSLWHPTAATATVTLASCGVALLLFLWRASRVASSNRVLMALDQICGHADTRVQGALNRAAQALRLRSNVPLPTILLVEVQCATPLLLGVVQPRLLLSPTLVETLSDDELELALRHELAHLKRRDHLLRWFQMWIEDVSRPILFAGRLGAYSIETEEMLCDRLAVANPRDASCLAQAITKAANLLKQPPPAGSVVAHLDDSVLPALLGKQPAAVSEQQSLKRRIAALLDLSKEMSCSLEASQPTRRRHLPNWRQVVGLPLLFLLSLLFFGVLYAKYYLLIYLH